MILRSNVFSNPTLPAFKNSLSFGTVSAAYRPDTNFFVVSNQGEPKPWVNRLQVDKIDPELANRVLNLETSLADCYAWAPKEDPGQSRNTQQSYGQSHADLAGKLVYQKSSQRKKPNQGSRDLIGVGANFFQGHLVILSDKVRVS